MSMRISKIKSYIGARVTGIDLTTPVGADDRQRLHDALVDNVALVIRGQKFSAAQFQAAGELFGDLMEDQNRRYLVSWFRNTSCLGRSYKPLG